MKKPNITEGEWHTRLDSDVKGIRDDNGGTIAVIHSMKDRSDAQAISAVPEMIDALIVFCQYFEHGVSDMMKHQEDMLSKGKKALKKAGCYENS